LGSCFCGNMVEQSASPQIRRFPGLRGQGRCRKRQRRVNYTHPVFRKRDAGPNLSPDRSRVSLVRLTCRLTLTWPTQRQLPIAPCHSPGGRRSGEFCPESGFFGGGFLAKNGVPPGAARTAESRLPPHRRRRAGCDRRERVRRHKKPRGWGLGFGKSAPPPPPGTLWRCLGPSGPGCPETPLLHYITRSVGRRRPCRGCVCETGFPQFPPRSKKKL